MKKWVIIIVVILVVVAVIFLLGKVVKAPGVSMEEKIEDRLRKEERADSIKDYYNKRIKEKTELIEEGNM